MQNKFGVNLFCMQNILWLYGVFLCKNVLYAKHFIPKNVLCVKQIACSLLPQYMQSKKQSPTLGEESGALNYACMDELRL